MYRAATSGKLPLGRTRNMSVHFNSVSPSLVTEGTLTNQTNNTGEEKRMKTLLRKDGICSRQALTPD